MALTPPNRTLLKRPTSTIRLPGGYQTGNPVDIARRYSPNAAAFKRNLEGFSSVPTQRVAPRIPSPTPTPTGSAGPTGATGMSAVDTAPMASMPTGVQPPQGNATQRWAETKEAWKAAGGTNRSLNKANVERGIRPAIDGRAAPDPKASKASDEIRQKWGWPQTTANLPY